MRQQLVVYRLGQQNELDPICVEKAETPVKAVLLSSIRPIYLARSVFLQRDSDPGHISLGKHRIAQEHCGAACCYLPTINAARGRRRYSAGQP